MLLHTRIPPDSSGTLVRHGPFAGIDRSHEPQRMQSLMSHLARTPLSARGGTWLLGVCCPARSRMTPRNLAERTRSAPTARANACRLGAHAVSRQLTQNELRRRIQSPTSFRIPPHDAKQTSSSTTTPRRFHTPAAEIKLLCGCCRSALPHAIYSRWAHDSYR